ncbi:Carbohydrate kinase, FGGY [Emticicia oligotrophica DSM 17448]|uniref:Carbohydrate kinase, FGGY n=1 Tax=Emticicia oligotrophica (strain DSM 17448 / CIP 109782 / MTCC 6937 / GPTSA100-15) TaxID=929562 RepID=A0ABN4AL37_EMTOG|nr:Carbohydrate kinase, FGGY [Emticicia oligotrophica DSM 17448]
MKAYLLCFHSFFLSFEIFSHLFNYSKLYFTGLDIGTTSTKAVVFDISGRVIAQKSINYQMIHSHPDWSEQNPDEIYNAVKECLDYLGKRSLIQYVSFSSAMHSIMAVDETGTPLTNLILWADNRAIQIANELKTSEIGQEIYHRTGTPIHPFSFLCKILWLKEHEPSIFKQTHQFIGIKEYVWFKLFGHYEIDYSLASATGMMNISNLEWDTMALALVGISANKFPTIVSPTFSRTMANKRFFMGAADGPLANLGTGAISPNKMALTIGTSGAVRVCSTTPYTDSQMRTFNYLLTDNQHIIGGATNNGAVILQWLKEQLLQTDESIEKLIENAEKVPMGADRLLFLPYLLGERAPIWNAEARGIFFGLSINHSQAHLTRAVLEGLILNIYSVGKILMEQNPITEICASGGFAKSSFWLQLVADIFQKKVVVSENVESSAWGAVILALQGLELEPKNAIQNTAKVFLPDESKATFYTELHQKFERIYLKMKDEF